MSSCVEDMELDGYQMDSSGSGGMGSLGIEVLRDEEEGEGEGEGVMLERGIEEEGI